MASQVGVQSERLPRGTLDRSAVVAAALELADREGLASVTMARVAAALGASAMSLYRHVRDKQELLEALADLALSELPAVAQDRRPWRARLEEFARGARECALRHPALIELMLDQGVHGSAATGVGLEWLALLEEAGFDEDASARAYIAFLNHLLGALVWEISRFRHGSEQFRKQEEDELARRNTPADSPLWHFGEVISGDREGQFEFGIRCLLDGFEAELRRGKRRSS